MYEPHRRRKRPVTACQPCYQKKQRCDRQVPCSNCARRQQPKLCYYAAATIRQSHGEAVSSDALPGFRPYKQQDVECTQFHSISIRRHTDDERRLQSMERLLDKFGFPPSIELETNEIPTNLISTLEDCFKVYPKRSITDTLVKSFFGEFNWSSQELNQALFTKTYQEWWSQAPVQGLERVLFGVLLLRVCCIGAEFLQPGSTMNRDILDVGISKVATHCEKLAYKIQDLVRSLPGTKSCIYAQITYLNAVHHWVQGRTETAWYTLSSAIRIVQYIGVDTNSQNGQRSEESILEDQAHRSMCLNLLIVDSTLCFFLDRPPTVFEKRLMELQSAGVVNRIVSRLESEPGPSDERLLLAGLWQHWNALKEEIEASSKLKSIPVQVEQRYHRLKESFIDQLPKAFSLDHPDKQWDQQNIMLKFQRNWLHTNILMVQCGILQDSLLLDHTEIARISQDKRRMAYRHVKLLARTILALREVLCNVYSLSGSTKGAISILRPFATRSAILVGLSFITIRSMHADSGGSRSWSDCSSEDTLSLDACRSHINSAIALLMALQGAPPVETEMRSLQAILKRIEDLGISNIESNAVPGNPGQQQFYKESMMGDATRSHDFLRAPADPFDGLKAFNAPIPINGLQGMENNNLWNGNYLPMLFDLTGSNKPVQDATLSLNLDCPMPLDMPIFDTSTDVVPHSTSESHWDSNIDSIGLDITREGLLNENTNLYI